MDYNSLSPEDQKHWFIHYTLASRRRLRRLNQVIRVLRPPKFHFDKKEDSFTYLFEPSERPMIDGIDIFQAFCHKKLGHKFYRSQHRETIDFLANHFQVQSAPIRKVHKRHTNYEGLEGKRYDGDTIYAKIVYHIITEGKR